MPALHETIVRPVVTEKSSAAPVSASALRTSSPPIWGMLRSRRTVHGLGRSRSIESASLPCCARWTS